MDGQGFVEVCASWEGQVSRLGEPLQGGDWGDARLGRQSGPIWEQETWKKQAWNQRERSKWSKKGRSG